MGKIINYFEGVYYTTLINIILAVVLLLISISKWDRRSKYNPMVFYFLSYLLLHAAAIVNISLEKYYFRLTWTIYIALEIITTLIELTVFINIIRKSISNRLHVKILKYTPLAFLLFIITTLILTNTISFNAIRYLHNLFSLQAILLSIGCFFYFINLFKNEPYESLSKEPSFWIISGVFYIMVCTLPFSLVGGSMAYSDFNLYIQLYTIFNVFYLLLFILILRSYFCNKDVNNHTNNSIYANIKK